MDAKQEENEEARMLCHCGAEVLPGIAAAATTDGALGQGGIGAPLYWCECCGKAPEECRASSG